MIIRRTQHAPEGSAFSLFAFYVALGDLHPLTIGGERIGYATLIGAIPSPGHRSVELVWEIAELEGSVFATVDIFAAHEMNDLPIDDFDVGNMFNPARAMKQIRSLQKKDS